MAAKKTAKSSSLPTWIVLPEIIDYATTDRRVLAKFDRKKKSAVKTRPEERQAAKKRK
jgi:hypothetical protein